MMMLWIVYISGIGNCVGLHTIFNIALEIIKYLAIVSISTHNLTLILYISELIQQLLKLLTWQGIHHWLIVVIVCGFITLVAIVIITFVFIITVISLISFFPFFLIHHWVLFSLHWWISCTLVSQQWVVIKTRCSLFLREVRRRRVLRGERVVFEKVVVWCCSLCQVFGCCLQMLLRLLLSCYVVGWKRGSWYWLESLSMLLLSISTPIITIFYLNEVFVITSWTLVQRSYANFQRGILSDQRLIFGLVYTWKGTNYLQTLVCFLIFWL